MANTPTNVLDELKRDEGLNLIPYKDSRGLLTIGYGTLLANGITEPEASFLLSSRLQASDTALLGALPWLSAVDTVRQAAIRNMAYNLGVAGLLEFKNMLAALQSGDYETAAQEALNSVWATQVGARAQRIAAQIKTGWWDGVTQPPVPAQPGQGSE